MNSRLSKIDTLWSLVQRANDPESPQARSAQQELWNRYAGAARRYLGAALRNDEAVDEVMQELGVKLASNAFRNADPHKGQFRVFMKTCLFRLVVDYRRRAGRNRVQAGLQEALPVDDEVDFTQPWREELLALAWARLSALEQEKKKPWHTVLRARIDHPELDSKQLASLVEEKLEKPVSSANYRVLLHRSREKFADVLVELVADSPEHAERDHVAGRAGGVESAGHLS